MHDGSIMPQPNSRVAVEETHTEYPMTLRTQSKAEVRVTVDILGIALYIPHTQNVVFADGQKPTPSVTEPGSIIPAHYTFIGFPPGTYQPPPNVKAGLSFRYDLAGDGDDEPYEAFVLSGHRVTFENVDTNGGQTRNLNSLASMRMLAPALDLKEGVADGKAPEVVACLELKNASAIRGGAHGIHSENTLKFGGQPVNCSEKLVAEFRPATNAPRIRLQNSVENVEITLIGDGPWAIMIANVPVEEIMDRNMLPFGSNVPLLHNELVYKLYDVTDPKQIQVPTCDHPLRMTADGVCGPPYKP